jgi:predicted N-acyltransferase
VFDHAWANAFHHYGGSYYPKLQSCVPFTPVTGPRILLRNHPLRDTVADGLLRSMQELAHRVSSFSQIWLTFSDL